MHNGPCNVYLIKTINKTNSTFMGIEKHFTNRFIINIFT